MDKVIGKTISFLFMKRLLINQYCNSVCKNIKVLENNTAIFYILAVVRKILRNWFAIQKNSK